MSPLPIIPTWVYLVIGFLLFVSGAATGTFATVHIYAQAHERELVKQKAAIEAAKAAEYARAVADTEQRLKANQKADAAAVKIKKVVVRVPGTCNIPSEAMRKLNDPALVGETQ